MTTEEKTLDLTQILQEQSNVEEIVEDFEADQTAEISSAMSQYLKAIKKVK